MIELEEEIEFTRDLYLFGKATFKYRGDLDKYNSEKSGVDHFSHERYYQIKIKNVKALQADQYHWKPKLLELKNFDNDIVGQIEGDDEGKYRLDIDRLFIIEPITLSHSQNEGDEIHGFVEDITVVFKMHRQETGVVCKKDIKTGAEEIREGVLYYEITTGERSESGECETVWVPEVIAPGIVCDKDKPTGNREEKDECYRLEYFSGELNEKNECATYWGDWICKEDPPPCVQGKWTGNQRRIGRCTQREYYNADCTTYWENYDCDGCLDGCSSLLGWIPLLIYTALVIWLAVKYGSFMPILFGIGLPLLLASFGWILNFLGRYPNGVNRFLKWIFNFMILLVLVSLLNGIGNLFDSSKWQSGAQQTEWKNADYEFEEIKYDENDPSYEEGNDEQLKVKLNWRDYEGTKYKGVYYLNREHIRNSTQVLKFVEKQDYSSYGRVYEEVFNHDKLMLSSVYNMLDSIKLNSELNERQFANIITTMVQSIEYVLILDGGCDDPMVMQNREIRQMLREYECVGFAPYGIKTPLEFLSTMKGDCDTRTLLLYTIFKHYKYDVAIINSEFYGHSMLGLSMSKQSGAYKLDKGRKYYFWETTSKGHHLGELPREMGNLNFWNVELN